MLYSGEINDYVCYDLVDRCTSENCQTSICPPIWEEKHFNIKLFKNKRVNETIATVEQWNDLRLPRVMEELYQLC